MTERADELCSSGEVKTKPLDTLGIHRKLNSITLLKYLSLSCLALAIISTIGLNLARSYSVTNTLANAEQGSSNTTVNSNNTATNANTNPNLISISIHSATDSCDTQPTSGANLCLQTPPAGGIAVGRHTITIQTGSSVAGYTVMLRGSGSNADLVPDDFGSSTSSNNNLIQPVGGNSNPVPLSNPTTLSTNEWGVAIPGNNGYDAESSYQSSDQATLLTTKYAAVPSKGTDDASSIIIDHSSSPANQTTGDSRNIYYGVRTSPSIQADTYSTEVTYTATAILPPAPELTSISTDTFYLRSGNDGTVTIKGDNRISSITNLYVDMNGNNKLDTGEECRDLTMDVTDTSSSTIICTMPTDTYRESLGLTTPANPDNPYPIRITYDTGDTTTNLTYRYLEPTNTNDDGTAESICQNATDESDCIVDIDTNMIPIKYVGTHTNPKWVVVTNQELQNNNGLWYSYAENGGVSNGGGAKWANAVTIQADKLQYYKDAMNGANPNVEVNNNDVLGYWVYIPRYAYEVQRRDAIDRVVSPQNFDIVFQTASEKNTPAPSCNSADNIWVDQPSGYGSTNDSNAGPGSSNVLAKDYRTGCWPNNRTYAPNSNNTTWATHPAFTWQYTTEANGFDKTYELNGIWIGKYETTGKITAPTVKPNQHANIDEYIGNFYLAAKSIGVEDTNNVGGGSSSVIGRPNLANELIPNSHHLNTATSHMLKNSEWGAITYLAHSRHGAGINDSYARKTNVNKNGAYLARSSQDADGDSSTSVSSPTGCGPSSAGSTSSYNTNTVLNADTIESATACGTANPERSYNGNLGILSSTTNTIYGVYGLSGGVSEYVAGNYTTSNTQTYGSTTSFNTKATTPYVDLYRTADGFTSSSSSKPSWSAGTSSYSYNYDVCTFETCGGNATYETTIVQSVSSDYQSWGSSHSYFVFSGGPWFSRGGGSNRSGANPFYAGYNGGSIGTNVGFRSALLSISP